MGTLSSLVKATTPTTSPAVPPQYMPPAGFQQRNLALIQDVQQIPGQALRGRPLHNVQVVVGLVPPGGAVRRRAQAVTSGALPKGPPVQLLVCATCQQVLSAEDFRSHRTVHDPS
ncbi:hypothetical protein MTO96_051749 [Rhipicephalus appendiculatus]